MKNLWSKFKIALIIIVFVAIILSLVYGLYYLISSRNTQKPLNVNIYSDSNLPITKIVNSIDVDYDKLPSGNKDLIIDDFIKVSLLKVPTITSSNLSRIIVPKLGINSQIIQNSDGDAALDKGFWYYPASSAFDGEKILFCHRRYWGKVNPNSCWYLDKLTKNDEIQLQNIDGSINKYIVVSSNQIINSDPGIVSVSNQDLVKIVTCAPLGFSTHRLVVIGARVK